MPRKKNPEFAVIGIDRDQRIVQNLSEDITQTITLDVNDENALREADIQLYDAVVVTLERDFKSKLCSRR